MNASATLLVALVLTGQAVEAPPSTPSWRDCFADAPADSLIGRIEDEGTSRDATDGLTLTRRHRWHESLQLLTFDAELNNTAARPVTAGRQTVFWQRFRIAEGPDALRYGRLEYRNDQWYGSTYWTGPDWTRVGRDWHHPGRNTPSVRQFTAPRDGRVTITGRVYKAHLDGDGIRAEVRHNQQTLWTAEIAGKDATGKEPKLTIDVRRGDAIRFVVDKLGQIYCDTTRWDPLIVYDDDGQRFQASASFSTTRQGEGGWSYTMQLDRNTPPKLPTVVAFDADLSLRRETLRLDRPLELSNDNAQPLVVLADGEDRSGVALMMSADARWRLRCTLGSDGLLDVAVSAELPGGPTPLAPGRSLALPRLALTAYEGGWSTGVVAIQRLLDAPEQVVLVEPIKERLARSGFGELPLLAMVQHEWLREDGIDDSSGKYVAATTEHLEKARSLLADLRAGRSEDFLAEQARRLDQLAAQAAAATSPAQQRRVYLAVRRLKRETALANPLMDFGELLFCKRVPTSYSHLVMQYYGWRARPGGGIFVLDRPGRSLACRDVTAGALAHGNVLEPCLSYDARRVVFSLVNCGGENPVAKSPPDEHDRDYYHLFEMNLADGNLRQLTEGPFDDLMPAYLPDGGVVFSSTRRRGYARCFGSQFGPRWHVYTLHRVDADGQDVRTLSWHDTNEWFPAVDHGGRVFYARWDYIDRDAVTHQNLWSMRPDGTDTTTVWGNATPSPHCAFQAKPIPGSGKIVFTASAHHSITAGSVAIVDPTVDVDGQHAITRVTPDIPFPEAEGRDIREYYTAPWPLSERYFLVGYSPRPLVWEPGANDAAALGIYLLDAFGNRELIYRDPQIGSTNPIPLVSRERPPALPSLLPEAAPPTGEMVLADVYQGLGPVERGTIQQIRVIQVFPKTTIVANQPQMGVAGEENGRAILGTAPVEADGSARFIVPARKPLLLQALDRHGFAYQTMRTTVYVQPGERVSCVGCHENRMTAPVDTTPLATLRPASVLDPGAMGGRPFSFAEFVQPVLDRHCVSCHGGEKTEAQLDLTGKPEGPWTRSYLALTRSEPMVPRFRARNQIQITPPGGAIGARGSGLMKLLLAGHEGVRLTDEELRRVAAWIDCNAIFFGTPDPAQHARQLRGEPVPMPEIQ